MYTYDLRADDALADAQSWAPELPICERLAEYGQCS